MSTPLKTHQFIVILLTTFTLSLAAAPFAAAEAGFVLAPEGGRLDARDEQGQTIGPCPLEHTDVEVHISGHFTRVDVTQRYRNPYEEKIEAVYTFPLSHRGAVDRMTMTIGDRVIEGEVKQRDMARRIYDAARQQGHVASLLEQERPNIFTQSVANIEPEAEIEVRISYVEVLESVDGEYQFQFPTVVAPRYIPGTPPTPADGLPDGIQPRRGLVMLAPAEIVAEHRRDVEGLSAAWLHHHATPIAAEGIARARGEEADCNPRVQFVARYDDKVAERGEIFNDGFGHVGGRWFFCPPRVLPAPGEPFARDTDEVPDASRITPMPVKPDERAGHDISITVHIDTGGPGIAAIDSPSHTITRGAAAGLPHETTISLKNEKAIPNRDFRLHWRLTSDGIEEAILTHRRDDGAYGDFAGGFFTLILQPPARVEDADVRPRELIFVLDNSGSMRGARLADRSALDAAKDVINQAIDTMRPDDRFNIVSFNNTLDALWDSPRANTAENRQRAQRYVDERQGGGGTEMRNAVLRALGAEPFQAHRPRAGKDGDKPMRIVLFVTDGLVGNDAAIIRAVREHAHETRVFTIGMSHSPNRHLLDEMALVGRGAVDYVLPEDDVTPIVERFADRIATPVLTDVELDFDGIRVTDVLPSAEHMTDLFDFEPLVIHGRYVDAGTGTLTIRGRTGAGPYERRLELTLPEIEPRHDTIATLWARRKVGELSREDDGEDAIIALGESFQIMTEHTSFIAVDRSRVTVGGEPKLVRVPIEFPKGMSWEGIFGGEVSDEDLAKRMQQAEPGRGRDSTIRPAVERDVAFQKLPAVEDAEGRAGQPRPMAMPAGPREPRAQHQLPDPQAATGSGAAQYHRAESPPAPRLGTEGLQPRWADRRDGLGRVDASRGRGFHTHGAELHALVRGQAIDAHLPGMPEGTNVELVRLPGLGDKATAARLREMLGGDVEAAGDDVDRLGRVVQADGHDDLYIFTLSQIAGLLKPHAEQLADDDVDTEAVVRAIVASLEQQLPRIRRDLELYRVLDRPLYKQVMALRDEPEAESAAERVQVTVLLADLEPTTLAALEQVGFEREATVADASFAVGAIARGNIEALALLDPVRRIEQMR